MTKRSILASLVVFLAGLSVCFAADPTIGTWKLNEAKSKFSPGSTKNSTVVYSPAADGMVTVTVSGIDKDGKAVHNVWTGKFDGKDYKVEGEAPYNTRSYTRVDANNLNLTVKNGDKVVATGKIAIAADGKSRTVTTVGTDPKVAGLTATAVYDKQ